MSITKIREVPRELPHAHIYLDDIEEICRILIEAYKKNTHGGEQEPATTFSTRDCRMDSIEDLEALGGSAKEFTIQVFVGVVRGSVSFRSFLNPELQNLSGSDEERWGVYGRIKAVFEHRQYRIKNMIFAVPYWLRWSLYALAMAGPSFLFPSMRQHPIMELGPYVIVMGVMFCIIFRPSRVSFVRFTERSKLRSEARKDTLAKFFWIVIATLVGSAVTILAQRFFPALKK